jgi:hypothetical protein
MNLLAILRSVFWLIVRWFKRRDAGEPQRKMDEADKSVAEHDTKKVNEILDRGTRL